MAEGAKKSTPAQVFVEDPDGGGECVVCLEKIVFPTVLPCGHVFCFLCVKGLIRTTGTCAMCRLPLPPSVTEDPNLLCPVDFEEAHFEDGQEWFYEGRGGGGWWQYDQRTSEAIENAFQQGDRDCEVSISGTIYVIDFVKMEQRQKMRNDRKRRIKRDSVSIQKRGISGIYTTVDATSGGGPGASSSRVN